ncbi:hypothetical protein DRW03_29400 [Corallococcus sp. H22C18031201]|uniref:APA family fibronectin-binding glycoprotein n=1 Tax=Citreicoccus inhibens TaxID=2849499 RepID=UPI000E70C810|nr:APA family fibronectin-binding glycoprotein [Citreicoccus inhibens]MBU8897431.1 hypothetical protein [Citreicoccus inhibens]RJS16791.1 hypothetical protein DRW03_29400 [Corallococcus sp. H22C18031201]
MRRWSLALLVSLASPAFAQAPEAAPTAPAPAEPASSPAGESPAPPRPAPTPRKAPAAPKEATPKAAPTATAKEPPPPPPVPAPPAGETPEPDDAQTEIRQEARFLFQSLLSGDVRNAAAELMYPFQLEDKHIGTPEELVQAWVKQIRLKRTDLVTLYDIEVMPLADMEKKHGKAPARLGLDLRNTKDVWVAVGNLSGHAAIFLFRDGGDQWRAFAYTD